MRIRILFLGMICLLCYSCSLKQQHVLFERNSPIAIDTSLSQANHYINRIKPDDQLQIRNLQSTKYLVDDAGSTNTNAGVASQVFTVEEDGHVKLPVLGSVFVAGLSRVEAQKKIENLYRDSLLKDPIIDLKIINLKVTIFGEAKSNGNFLLNKEKTTLIDILGQAGGLSVNADEKTIKIIRGKNQTVIPVDLSNIKTIADPRLIMQDVWIDCLVPVTIGANCCLSHGAILLTGSHDYKKHTFDLITGPIVLEDGVWIGAGAIVNQGITIASHAILTAGSVANTNLEAYFVYRGNPAVKIRPRPVN